MTELVHAQFDATSAADAAAQDLEVARIPSAVIRRGVARPTLTVAVDERHTGAVTGILNQYGPHKVEERAAKSHRR
jgi:hypothetical protein